MERATSAYRPGQRAELPLKRHRPLTARQREALGMYERGLSRREIARAMGVKRIDHVLDDALAKTGR